MIFVIFEILVKHSGEFSDLGMLIKPICSPVLVVAALACRRFCFCREKHIPVVLNLIYVISLFFEFKEDTESHQTRVPKV